MTEDFDPIDQLQTTARDRMPSEPRPPRRRWPFGVAAGLVVAGVIGVAVVLAVRRDGLDRRARRCDRHAEAGRLQPGPAPVHARGLLRLRQRRLGARQGSDADNDDPTLHGAADHSPNDDRITDHGAADGAAGGNYNTPTATSRPGPDDQHHVSDAEEQWGRFSPS